MAGDGRPADGSSFGVSWEGMEDADSARAAAGVSELRGWDAAASGLPSEDGEDSEERVPLPGAGK